MSFNNDFFNESNSDFLAAYIKSKAFADNPEMLIYALKDFPGPLFPLLEAIFTICEVFSATLKEESRNTGSIIPYAASEASSLLLRLYEQSQADGKGEIANRCLDIWDILFENRVGSVVELTKAIDK